VGERGEVEEERDLLFACDLALRDVSSEEKIVRKSSVVNLEED
jgi:hypothetical protein